MTPKSSLSGPTQRVWCLISRLGILAMLALLTSSSNAALKGWWRFNGNLNDGSGTGLTGSNIVGGAVTGSAVYDADVPPSLTGQSVWLNSTNTENTGVRIAANAALNSTQFTLGYYINLRGVTPGTSGLERLTARAGYAFETAVGNANALGGTSSPTGITLSYYTGGAWYRTHVPISTTGWVHVAWRNSATDMQLYINGSLAYTGPGKTTAFPASGNYMNFGTAQTNAEGYTGLMADAFLFDTALPAADIALIAASGVSGYFDTDGDGLPSAWETQYGFDPNDNGTINPVNGASGNPDNDGLTNIEEFTRGTNPIVADTDNDGINDGAEVAAGTNPAVADTDGDGLKDGEEATAGTNPLLADTDGDFVNDKDEITYGSNPLDPVSTPPPSTFLVMQLGFEGDALDSSPAANNGTLLNGPAFVDGESPGGGKALQFANAAPVNGMGVEVPGNNSLASNAFTLCYWVKPTSNQEGSGLERLTSRSSDLFETAIGNRSGIPPGAPNLTLSYFQGGWQNSGKQLVLNEWAHVVWRNKGPGTTDMNLYINGQLAFTGPGLPVGRPGNGIMRIGTRANGLPVEGFEGMMDDVRLYRIPLKDSDIGTLSTPIGLAPFAITSIVREADGSKVTLKIRTRPGRVYAVDYCTELLNLTGPPGVAPGWVELTDFLPATGAETTFEDSVGSNLFRAFYRARDITP